jgi:ATP-dependent helicase/nuclease subunit A
LSTREARDAMALVDLMADRDDDIALATLLRGPFFAVSDRALFDISLRREKDETWWELISRDPGATHRAYQILSHLLTFSRRLTAAELLTAADEMTGYTSVIANLPEGDRRMADWDGFVSLLRDLESFGYADAFSASRHLAKLRDANTIVPRPQISAGDAVSVMTIHGSKGLEWPIVFVTDLARDENQQDGTLTVDSDLGVAFKLRRADEKGKMSRVAPSIFTLIKKRTAEKEADEARRLLYVAITRARDRVYLTAAGKIENNVRTILPGLEAAGVRLQKISPENVPEIKYNCVGNQPGGSARKLQIGPLNYGISSIPVTGLAEYAACPRRFKYRYIDGHQGLGEGGSSAMTIGSLAHLALELDITNGIGLMPFIETADQAAIDDALRLAENFRSSESFAEFRIENVRREVPISIEYGGARLNGFVDLVGDDFVLDYKTDGEMEPRHHLLQLWVYAKALSKPRAVLAYLRHDQVYLFSVEDLAAAEVAVSHAVAGVVSGAFNATASEDVCRRCAYSTICDDCYKN